MDHEMMIAVVIMVALIAGMFLFVAAANALGRKMDQEKFAQAKKDLAYHYEMDTHYLEKLIRIVLRCLGEGSRGTGRWTYSDKLIKLENSSHGPLVSYDGYTAYRNQSGSEKKLVVGEWIDHLKTLAEKCADLNAQYEKLDEVGGPIRETINEIFKLEEGGIDLDWVMRVEDDVLCLKAYQEPDFRGSEVKRPMFKVYVLGDEDDEDEEVFCCYMTAQSDHPTDFLTYHPGDWEKHLQEMLVERRENQYGRKASLEAASKEIAARTKALNEKITLGAPAPASN